MIQVERESAELRADEIESRVNSGSMDGLNVTLRPRSTIPTSVTALSLASASPPVSGRSTPKMASRSTAHELGVMTLVSNHSTTHAIKSLLHTITGQYVRFPFFFFFTKRFVKNKITLL